MNKFKFLSRGTISAKLFLITLLICMMFFIIAGAVLISFRYTEDELTRGFVDELDRVSENARLERELAPVITDTNLLMNRFYGRENFLKSEGERLINKIYILMLKASDVRLKESLDEFIKKMRIVIKQCEMVNQGRQEIRATDQEFDSIFVSLDKKVSEKIANLLEKDVKTSILQQLPVLISEYREIVLQTRLLFIEQGLAYFQSPVMEKEHPILILLEKLQTKTRPLMLYGSDISAYGRQIAEVAREYRKRVLKFHKVAGELKLQLHGMNQERENVSFRMDEINRHIRERSEQKLEILTDRISRVLKAGTVAAFIAAMTVIILVSLLGRSVAKSLKLVVARIRDIAEGEGDLTARLEVRNKDELGELAECFNIFIENLRNLVKDVKDQARTLNAFATDMSSVSARMSVTADEVSIKSGNVASSAEEMSININTMAASAEEISVTVRNISSTADQMSQNMNSVASSVEEMSMSINDISGNAREGVRISGEAMDMAKTATTAMESLGNAVKEIGAVIEIIREIAERTNLLALNARIEAASAGEAGKGFAVVANEIKELANQTTHAATDVAGRIEGVQKNTRDAIRVIDDVSVIIRTINESTGVITQSVEQQTHASCEISSNVLHVNNGVNNIASSISGISQNVSEMSENAAETAKATNDVADNIRVVNKAASDSSAGVREISISAEELAGVAEQLQGLVGKFKVRRDA
ncbi:methyl-accepting chemotaxis protein [Desulfococcaceae bacterium HSG8]|nr:methyl-accepting chemotaxis protein [Desulfococcaceae bacterium HSG8]